jgi:hypothetical protein
VLCSDCMAAQYSTPPLHACAAFMQINSMPAHPLLCTQQAAVTSQCPQYGTCIPRHAHQSSSSLKRQVANSICLHTSDQRRGCSSSLMHISTIESNPTTPAHHCASASALPLHHQPSLALLQYVILTAWRGSLGLSPTKKKTHAFTHMHPMQQSCQPCMHACSHTKQRHTTSHYSSLLRRMTVTATRCRPSLRYVRPLYAHCQPPL